MKFKYRCLKCKKFFKAAGPTSCTFCGHPYVKWTNYEKEFAK